MIALAQFVVILSSVLFSRYYFSNIIDKIKQDLEKKKQEKFQMQREYEIRLQSKKPSDKTPYELKLDEIKKQEEEIQNLKRESEQYNNTDSYAKYSKIQRQVLKLNQQLEKDKQGLEELKKQDEVKRSQQNQNEDSQEEQQWRQKQSELTNEINELVNREPTTKKKERLINGFMPLMCIFLFSNFQIILPFDVSNTLWPLNYLITNVEGNTTIFSRIIWVFVCFRVISIIHDYFIKKSSITDVDKKDI